MAEAARLDKVEAELREHIEVLRELIDEQSETNNRLRVVERKFDTFLKHWQGKR